jgi:2-chlorobenzoate 1,2-dioxygenase
MPDDVEVYARCQQGNATRGGEWVSMHRYHGRDRELPDGMVSTNGTSELPMRNQFAAWRQFMLDAEDQPSADDRELHHEAA